MRKIIVFLIVVLCAGGIYFFVSGVKTPPSSEPTPSEPIATPTLPVETKTVDREEPSRVIEKDPTLANTYINIEYGFEIQYPDSCDALDDDTNLYGWPNGIVLFHCGGQAYDIAVEVWDSLDEYQQKYPNEDPYVKKINSKYITVSDMGKTDTTYEIITTFSTLD